MGSPGVGKYGPAWNSLNLSTSSEDCLYLNVFSPDGVGQPLPVMVWLHAGEFRFGASNDGENNWPYFANGSAVLITANVRLGLLGFAALDALRERDPSGSSGNYGMQDQRAVLRWVSRCISSFGGDPERVTIFGESSGGASVAFHLLSSRSGGLFRRAILQSPGLTQSKSWRDAVENTQYAVSALTAAGSPSCRWPTAASWLRYPGLQANGMRPLATRLSLEEGLQRCRARADCFLLSVDKARNATLFGGRTALSDSGGVFLFNVTQAVGADPGVEVYVRTPDEGTAVQCLVSAKAADLVNLDTSPPHDDTFYTDAAAPTEDGVELAAPLAALARGPVPSGVGLLAGSNLDEGTMFMDECPAIACNASEADFEAWAVKMYGADLGRKVPAAYRSLEAPTPRCREQFPARGAAAGTSRAWQSAMRSAGDSAILCRTRELLRAAHGGAWWYYFTATPLSSVNERKAQLPYLGAFHGAEVPFVFGDAFEFKSDGERRLSRAMGCYWVNFAATGDPNRGPSGCAASLSLPAWPAFGGESDAIVFSNTTIGTRRGLKREQCDLFAQYGRVARGDILLT
mmetsp:Transcript_131556/g.409009  ORF Transcript_131556/g.409009 Transcript_131556/m.409009 type:complete len:573 (+) Transcript_131556:3-1721(+)